MHTHSFAFEIQIKSIELLYKSHGQIEDDLGREQLTQEKKT